MNLCQTTTEFDWTGKDFAPTTEDLGFIFYIYFFKVGIYYAIQDYPWISDLLSLLNIEVAFYSLY